MKLLFHASTQIQLSYLRICIFHFSSVPIDLPIASVCYVPVQYFAPTLRVKVSICTYGYSTYGQGIRCTCTVHTVIVHLHIVYLNLDSNFAHELTLITLQSSQCTVHNFDLELNLGGGLEPPSQIVTSPMVLTDLQGRR